MNDAARREHIKQICDYNRELAPHLFTRGFLITTRDFDGEDVFPFYDNWNKTRLSDYNFWVHNRQKFYSFNQDGADFFLIGHAYNPFSMEHEEKDILRRLAGAYNQSEKAFLEAVDELTGVFILGTVRDDELSLVLDCSGMQYCLYGRIGEQFYAASHMRLIGDILNLKTDDYVNRLISYRWYRYMFGNYLPGDLTAFSSFKRLIPNMIFKHRQGEIETRRFYPARPLQMCQNEEDYSGVLTEACRIMKNNMALIARKWDRPAISLTGGIDSNTTFAAANGLYDRFTTFTYISMPREKVDAGAAGRISEAFGVRHETFPVPDNNSEIQDFAAFEAILDHNAGEIGPLKDNDTRKKITLMRHCNVDVEVKSWISETFRAYAYKYFGLDKMPPNIRPRHYSSFFKFFGLNRPLLWQTDRHFQDYIEGTALKENLYNYDESDLFVWEMMHGGKCGLNITTMKFCFDITIPYNNRLLLDLLLRVPLADRISDRHHWDMKKLMNEELAAMGIYIKNLNETKMRARMLKTYFLVNSGLPF